MAAPDKFKRSRHRCLLSFVPRRTAADRSVLRLSEREGEARDAGCEAQRQVVSLCVAQADE